MLVIVSIDTSGTIVGSTEVQRDYVFPESTRYIGPFNVPDVFQANQFLYRLVDGKLLFDEDEAERHRLNQLEIEKQNENARNQLDDITTIQLALAELYEVVIGNG